MTKAKPPDQYADADPAYRADRARKAVLASRDPRLIVDRITDPVLAAEIVEVAARRARELVAERPFEPEVLDRVAALLGPIPKAGASPHGT